MPMMSWRLIKRFKLTLKILIRRSELIKTKITMRFVVMFVSMKMMKKIMKSLFVNYAWPVYIRNAMVVNC